MKPLWGVDILQNGEEGLADILLSQGIKVVNNHEIPYIQVGIEEKAKKVTVAHDLINPGLSEAVVDAFVMRTVSDLERNLGEEASTPGPLPKETEMTMTGGGQAAGSSSGSTIQKPLLTLPLDLSFPREENILEESLGRPAEGPKPICEPVSKAPDERYNPRCCGPHD